MIASIVLLEAAQPTNDVLLQYGVLGVFAVLMIIIIRALYTRETKRADDSAAMVDKLNEYIRDKCVPALIAAADALKEHENVDRDILVELRRIRGQ